MNLQEKLNELLTKIACEQEREPRKVCECGRLTLLGKCSECLIREFIERNKE